MLKAILISFFASDNSHLICNGLKRQEGNLSQSIFGPWRTLTKTSIALKLVLNYKTVK
jgi:hypothetical protein